MPNVASGLGSCLEYGLFATAVRFLRGMSILVVVTALYPRDHAEAATWWMSGHKKRSGNFLWRKEMK